MAMPSGNTGPRGVRFENPGCLLGVLGTRDPQGCADSKVRWGNPRGTPKFFSHWVSKVAWAYSDPTGFPLPGPQWFQSGMEVKVWDVEQGAEALNI